MRVLGHLIDAGANFRGTDVRRDQPEEAEAAPSAFAYKAAGEGPEDEESEPERDYELEHFERFGHWPDERRRAR